MKKKRTSCKATSVFVFSLEHNQQVLIWPNVSHLTFWRTWTISLQQRSGPFVNDPRIKRVRRQRGWRDLPEMQTLVWTRKKLNILNEWPVWIQNNSLLCSRLSGKRFLEIWKLTFKQILPSTPKFSVPKVADVFSRKSGSAPCNSQTASNRSMNNNFHPGLQPRITNKHYGNKLELIILSMVNMQGRSSIFVR